MRRDSRVGVIQDYAQDIVDTVREPLLILDTTLRVRSANRAFYQAFRVSPGETEGRLIYELGNGQWDIPALRTLLEDIVPESSVFDDFELEHDFPAIGRRVMLLNARKLRPGRHAELLVLAMEDVTERRRAEEELEQTNARLAKAHGRMSRDLKAAARIQETFLPRALPPIPGADFAWAYRPCDELAGDGLNVIPLGRGRVALYILDVSGHGVAASLLSVTLSRVLSPPSEPSSILVREGAAPDRLEITPPAEVADRLNRLFPYDTAIEQFATMIYGVLDARTGEFRYVSAGHPGPVHLPVIAGPVILESQGFPIGLAEDAYEERSVRLAAGDRLYLYSDGVSEAMSPAGEWFGEARLLEAIGRGRAVPLPEGVAALLGEVERWRGAASAQDDISILAVEVSAATGRGEPGVAPLPTSQDPTRTQ
jgi:phosphoserine phosphatase RsbU/P